MKINRKPVSEVQEVIVEIGSNICKLSV